MNTNLLIKSFFKSFIFSVCFLCLNLQGFAQTQKTINPQKPNIIFILTDDLGIGDLGVYFQNQRALTNDKNKPFTFTPYLDKMAKNGATMEQYCAAPVCAPSRASLLTGQSQGHATIRDNQFDKALENNYTLGNVMQVAGYQTIAIGKWGLQGDKRWDKNGASWPAVPLKRGFDHFYGYMRHKDGHEHYPNEGLYDGKKEVYNDYQVITSGLDKSYTGDLWTAKAKKYIIDHENGKDKNKPFFMYLAYDTPHAVMELPTVAYPAGFGLKGGVQWLGKSGEMINTAKGTPDSFIDPIYSNETYDHDDNLSTPEVAWPDIYKRYATITKRIDQQIHDILTLLKDLKIDDNTLVIFTSDNGPSIESNIANKPLEANFFESFGPFDGVKRDVLEGGIRMPAIAYWPKHIKANLKINNPSISYDWMPTFLDAAGYTAPVRTDGVSLLPQLIGKPNQQKSQIYIEYFQNGNTPDYKEFDQIHRNKKRNQMQMLRIGDTVAVRYNIQTPDDDFEIYDIKKDPKQTKDLAKIENLLKLENYLKGRVLQMRLPDSSAKRPYDIGMVAANTLNIAHSIGWKVYQYQDNSPWISKPNATINPKTTTKFDFTNLKTNSCMYEAYLNVPESGAYTFKLSAQGKAFIRLHDIALIDEDANYAAGTEKSVTINLMKGDHLIKVYFKKVDNVIPALSLKWGKKNNILEDIKLSDLGN